VSRGPERHKGRQSCPDLFLWPCVCRNKRHSGEREREWEEGGEEGPKGETSFYVPPPSLYTRSPESQRPVNLLVSLPALQRSSHSLTLRRLRHRRRRHLGAVCFRRLKRLPPSTATAKVTPKEQSLGPGAFFSLCRSLLLSLWFSLLLSLSLLSLSPTFSPYFLSLLLTLSFSLFFALLLSLIALGYFYEAFVFHSCYESTQSFKKIPSKV